MTKTEKAAYRKGREDALKLLASAFRKVLTPKQLEELKWTCDPLGEFAKVLRADSTL